MSVDYYGAFILGVKVPRDSIIVKVMVPYCTCYTGTARFCPNCGKPSGARSMERNPEWVASYEDTVEGFDVVRGTDTNYVIVGKRTGKVDMGVYHGGCQPVPAPPKQSGAQLRAFEQRIRDFLRTQGVDTGPSSWELLPEKPCKDFGYWLSITCSY